MTMRRSKFQPQGMRSLGAKDWTTKDLLEPWELYMDDGAWVGQAARRVPARIFGPGVKVLRQDVRVVRLRWMENTTINAQYAIESRCQLKFEHDYQISNAWKGFDNKPAVRMLRQIDDAAKALFVEGILFYHLNDPPCWRLESTTKAWRLLYPD